MSLRFKSMFHWKHSKWVIELCGGAALATALASQFYFAYFFLFVTTFYSIGCWLTSDTLARKRQSKPVLYGPDEERLPSAVKTPLLWRLVPTAAMLVLFGFFGLWIRGLQIDKELESLSGWLYPAGEHVDVPCPLAYPDDLVLVCGTNSYFADKFPHTVIAINCDNVLSVDRDVNGRVGITLTILDKDGKVVVDLDHGQFTVNRNNYFKIDRQRSRSTLSVVDQYKQEVLYLHLASKNVLQFRALFNYRGVPIRIDDSHPFGNFGNNSFEGGCLHGGIADVQIGQCLAR